MKLWAKLLTGNSTLLYTSSVRTICSSTIRSNKQKEDFLAEVRKKIEENRRTLVKKGFSHIKSRGLISSSNNLRLAMQSAQQKVTEAQSSSISNIPSHVSLEILGNGTTHLLPCVVIRTPQKVYMFNCPEGTSRFLAQLRIKSLNVLDIFVTKPTWDNIAGISSILLSKEANALPCRLHGAVNIKTFLECIRPFSDADYGSTKYPSQVDEMPYTMGSYEDVAAKFTYIPLMGKSTNSSIDVAYLCELKSPARRIDPLKLIAMKVPKGPLIGKLKNGESVTLPDGRTLNPEDVYTDSAPKSEFPKTLIVECSSEDHVESLINSSALTKFVSGKEQLNYVVHLTKPDVLSKPIYKKLSEMFGSQCCHIVLNEQSPCVPGIESIYRNHRLLNSICPVVFPPLYPLSWSGLVSQGCELERKDGVFTYAAPLQKYFMRPGGNEEPIIADLRDGKLELSDRARKLIDELTAETSQLEKNAEFPKISFLGTSSAVPSKYRNVTGYLMETSCTSNVMVDVGEGSYGQIKVLKGPEKTEDILLNMKAVFITHAHQDHMNGLYTIIQRRQEAFAKRGITYVPLVLVTTRNVLRPLKTYSMSFENLEALVEIVDMSRFPSTPPVSPGGPPNKRARHQSPTHSASREIVPHLPTTLYDPSSWAIEECKTVQVHHTRMANGFIFVTNGKKIVFSGDTKPCDLLVDEGKGADLLIHEATFEDGHEANALKKKHSTMGQAVDVGKRMGAKHVILTHFSARYPKVPELPLYLDQCGNVSVAMDNMSVRFDHLPILPKLIPIYREVYQEELFEIELKKGQRNLKVRNETAESDLSNRKAIKT